jgi:two-component system, sensor histidine kinase and response regulator
MNLAVRVILITALLTESNLFTLGGQQDSLKALLQGAKDEQARAMLYLQIADTKKNGQVEALKEAENIFKSNKNNTIGIETYLKFGNYYLSVSEPDSAIAYFEKARFLSEIFNDQFYIARSNREIGNYYLNRGDLPKAREYSLRAKEVFTSLRDTFWLLPQLNFMAKLESIDLNKTKSWNLYQEVLQKGQIPRDADAIATANFGLGNLCLCESNFYDAFVYFKNSKEVWEKNNNSDDLARTLNKLGLIYQDVGIDSLAFTSYSKSLEIAKDNNPAISAEANIGLSSVYFNNGNSEEALTALNAAIQNTNSSGNTFLYVLGIIRKADINCQTNNYPESQVLIEGALKIIEEKKFFSLKAEGLEVYSKVLYNLGNHDEALRVSTAALEIAQTDKNLEQVQKNSYMLGKLMSEKGQFISASHFLLMSNQFKDSLDNRKNNNKLKNAVFGYELVRPDYISERSSAKKERKTSIINRQEANNRLQNLLLISIILLVILISFFSVLVFKGYRSNKKLYNDLSPIKNAENKSSDLEKLAVLNNKIFSVISHDLRSPIISIKDSIDFLRQEGLDEETKQEALIMSEELTEATLNLLDNLLGWAKNQKKKVEPKKLQIKILDEIKQIEYLYKASFNKKDITFKIDCGDDVLALADNELINLALRNLVSNAIKFTPRGGSIFITGENYKNNVLIAVRDTGIGISKEDQLKILTPDTFYTKNGTENESGSGIGLKLVNEFIKLMGGELKIESSTGFGSKFYFTLPAFETKKKPIQHEPIFNHIN